MRIKLLILLLIGVSQIVVAKNVSQALMRKRGERLLASVNKINDAEELFRKTYKNNNPVLMCAMCNQGNEWGGVMFALSCKVLAAAEHSRNEFVLWIEHFEAFAKVFSLSTAECLTDFMVCSAYAAGFSCRRCKSSVWRADIYPDFYLKQQAPLMISH